MNAGEVLRIGVLGAARIAPTALLRPAKRAEGVEVRAVAARDASRAAAFARKHGIPVVHESYDALVADPELDAVYNPLPNGLHGMWTQRALEAGKHVLCEKPLTANADEARAVASAARAGGRVLMEAFHWRYHPLGRRMLEVAREELGALRHVEAHLCAPILKRGDIRFRLDLAGGAMMDMGCYVLDMVRALTGEEPRVESAKPTLISEGVDRAMDAELRFPSGATGRIVCSLLSKRVLAISARAEGERGTLRVLNPVLPQLFHRFRVRTDAGTRSERFPGATTYGRQLEAFACAVRKGEPFPSDAQNAIANMAAIDAVYRAAGMQPRTPTTLAPRTSR